MSETTTELVEKVLALPEEDRREVFDRLAASFDEVVEPLSEAWREEIRRRIAQIDAGEVEMIPGEDVLRELRERYGARNGL